MLVTCTFVVGDGTGGTEKYIEKTTTENECADLVRRKETKANGATWGSENEKCYAEFGATGNSGTGSYRTCLFRGKRLCFQWKACFGSFIT